MRPKHLLAQLALPAIAFVLLNGAIALRSERLPSRDILHKIQRAQGFDTLFVGNSLMANGVKEREFDAALGSGSSLNIGLNSSKSAEHSLLLRHTLARQPRLRRCILGYFDTQLSDPPGKLETIQGHQTIAFVLEPTLAARYYTQGFWERQQFWFFTKVPYLAERTALWMRVEQVRRSLEGLGMPRAQATTLGRVSDFRRAGSGGELERLYREALARPRLLNAPMQQFLLDARQSAEQVIVIRMPIRSREQTPQMVRYHERLRQEVVEQGGLYLDATRWGFSPAWFEDEIHLNEEGAHHFSQRLAEQLR